jgi:hypothetical protein
VSNEFNHRDSDHGDVLCIRVFFIVVFALLCTGPVVVSVIFMVFSNMFNRLICPFTVSISIHFLAG